MGGGGSTIEIGGRRLAWRSVGEGPPLLLVNGYAATGGGLGPPGLLDASWDVSFESDLPRQPGGRGVGARGPEELTVDSMAADLEGLLDSLGVGRVPVAGLVDGRLRRAAAGDCARHQRVAALVLFSTDPGGPETVSPGPHRFGRG